MVVKSCVSPIASSSEIVLLVVRLKSYLYQYTETEFFWPELTFFLYRFCTNTAKD